MNSRWKNLLKRTSRPLCGGRRRRSCPLQVEALETRLTPAFNLTIGTAATVNVTHNAAAGTFVANATGATINVADIKADLLAGKNVTISDGTGGAENGDITWLAGADLDYNGVGLPGVRLNLAVDPSAVGGSVTLNAQILDSNPATPDALNVSVSATRDVTVNGSILASYGAVTLAADTRPDGTGDDGFGTLALGPGSTVSGTAVTLRGADIRIDTSSNPATVAATTHNAVFASIGHLAESTAVDAQGNIYVTNGADNSVSKVTPQGHSSIFLSGLNGGPAAVAVDAQGNIYVSTINDNTIRKVSPDGKTVTIFTQQVSRPNGLTFDAQGNLYVSSDPSTATPGTVFKVSPDGKTVTPFVTGILNPTGLAFDAQGNFYVVSQSLGTISKVSPDGKTVTPFAGGFLFPVQLAFDAQGYLYVTSPGTGYIGKVSPLGLRTVYATGNSLNAPGGLAFDAAGTLYVANFGGPTLSRVTPGTVTVRSSLPTRPIAVGGVPNQVAGVNLTGAELARITATDVLTIGDPGQEGDVSLITAATLSNQVRVVQDQAGPGTILLDDGVSGTGLNSNGGDIYLTAGAGGVRETNFLSGALGLNAGAGGLYFASGGSVGTPARPLAVRAAGLGPSTVAGALALSNAINLTTTGPISAGFIDLVLAGNFVSHAGDLRAPAIDLVFAGAGTQTLDDGGQSFTDLAIQPGADVLLVNNPLVLAGTLTDGGKFEANGLNLSVAGLILEPGASLSAPTGFLSDSGDWINEGGLFKSNGGTVVLDGVNQRVFGSTNFSNLTKTATAADTLTFQAFSSQYVAGMLVLEGTPNAPLALRSSIPGVPWELQPPTGGVSLADLLVQDSVDLFSSSAGADIATTFHPSTLDVQVQTNVTLPSTGVVYGGPIARYSGPGDTNMYWGGLIGINGQFQADIFRNVGGVWTLLASTPVNTGSGTVKLAVQGTSLKLYLNGNLVAFASDNQLTATGRAGVRTSAGVPATAVSVAASAPVFTQLPFSDNFDTQADGSQLSLFWSDRLGDTTVKNHQVVTAVNDPTSADVNKCLSLTTLNGLSVGDVSIQADVTVGATGVQYSGLVARYNGPSDSNMYWAALIGINGKFQADIFRNIGGVWTLLASTPVGTGTATLRFEAFGPSLKLFVNGVLTAFASDTALTSGTVGLRSSGGITIDNFACNSIQAVAAATPFNSDFNAQADGEQLTRVWQDRLGDETIQNHQVASHVNDPASADITKSLALATLNGLNAADVTVQTDIAVATTGISYGGVVARYSGQGDQNMYWAGVVGVNGSYQAVIYVNVNGLWTQLANSGVGSGAGTLKFEVKGTTLKLTFGGLTLTAMDSQLTSGTVGIRGGGGVTYDNFSVA
jgi:sugar lactone lactonase YvrE